MSLLLAI